MSEESFALTLPMQPTLPPMPYQDAVAAALMEHRFALSTALERLTHDCALAQAATCLVETLRAGRKVLIAGNGGSAAEAQHFAAELVGRFKRERSPYAVISLTTDTSILTAVANDYGYQDVFSRQVRALGQPNDLFIAFSTSGQSENLTRAARAARERLMSVIAITGRQLSRLERVANVTVHTPLDDTATIQEIHMMVTHILCDIAEAELAALEGTPQ